MNKVALERWHVPNNCIYLVDQIKDGVYPVHIHLQPCLDSVENEFNRAIARPVWRTKNNTVSTTINQVQDNWMPVEIYRLSIVERNNLPGRLASTQSQSSVM